VLSTLSAIPEPAAAAAPAKVQRGAAGDFRSEVWAALGRKADAQDPRVRWDAAAQVTSQLFFAPLLAEARRSNLGGPLASGGRVESAFGERLDLYISDVVARSDAGGLTSVMTGYLDGPPRNAAAGREGR